MRLRSGRGSGKGTSTNGSTLNGSNLNGKNRNNSADNTAEGVGDGDNEAPLDEQDIDEVIADMELRTDQLIRLTTESGQGDAKELQQTCTDCAWTVLRYCGWILLNLSIFLILFLVVLAPMTVKLFPEIPKHIVYLNAFKIPYHVNLSDPASVELNYSRNFYLQSEENITIGVWHILPKSLERNGLVSEDFPKLLASGKPIMLYCHGNTGTRGTSHRIDMYKVLAAQDWHVVALDYRGYGDSTGSPTSENGVMTDVVKLYIWLREQAGPDTPIYVWGHSLGTGISTKAVRFLTEQQKDIPSGLILESPFNNIFDAAMEHPFSRIFRLLWWFDDVFLEAMHTYGIYLQSDEHILHIPVPVLILHAEDDFVVPYTLGEKLYEASKKRPESFPPVTFHGFSSDRGFMHKWICTAEELPDIVKKFMAGAESKSGGSTVN